MKIQFEYLMFDSYRQDGLIAAVCDFSVLFIAMVKKGLLLRNYRAGEDSPRSSHLDWYHSLPLLPFFFLVTLESSFIVASCGPLSLFLSLLSLSRLLKLTNLGKAVHLSQKKNPIFPKNKKNSSPIILQSWTVFPALEHIKMPAPP